jgi:AraC-like DNA-binding protein
MVDRTYSRKIHLFPPDRPRWLNPRNDGAALHYLAWGDRFFGRDPVPVYLHEGWSYTVILQGTPLLMLDRKSVRLRAGDAVLIGPDCPMGWGGESPRSKARVLGWSWLGAPFFLATDEARERWYRTQLSDEALRRLEGFHSRCRQEVEMADSATTQALEGLRAMIDVELCRHFKIKRAMTDNALRFQLAVRWMERHLNLPSPMRLLCEYLQVSSATLKNLFREKAQTNPQAYFQKLKFRRAEKLLTEDGLAVKAVAFELGYRHANDFSRAYHRFAGRSPSAVANESVRSR